MSTRGISPNEVTWDDGYNIDWTKSGFFKVGRSEDCPQRELDVVNLKIGEEQFSAPMASSFRITSDWAITSNWCLQDASIECNALKPKVSLNLLDFFSENEKVIQLAGASMGVADSADQPSSVGGAASSPSSSSGIAGSPQPKVAPQVLLRKLQSMREGIKTNMKKEERS